GQVKEQMDALIGYVAAGSRYFSVLFKVVGITWICEFVAGVCRDSGFGAVASQVELFGKIAILFAGMPVFLALIETIAQFAG
ncbi:MAG TPA: stage III sporulation protein AD, partial [Lachnospiraceae bacterium]|nr:stage III sporulation protein AD [Lachnospiraceae bacterium]